MISARIVEYVAFGAAVIGGGTWVGSIDNEVNNTSAKVQALEPIATGVAVDIGVLKERTENMQKQMDRLELDNHDILEELRKK